MGGRGWEGEVGRERERMGGRGCGQLMNSGKFARFQRGTKYRPGKGIFFSPHYQGLNPNTITPKRNRKSSQKIASFTKKSPLNCQNCHEVAQQNYKKRKIAIKQIILQAQHKICLTFTRAPKVLRSLQNFICEIHELFDKF